MQIELPSYVDFLKSKIKIAPDTGIEFQPESWMDGLVYLKAAEMEISAPTLFDFS